MKRERQPRIRLVVLVGAVVLAGAGGAAVGFVAPAWAGAVAAVTALVAVTVADRVYHARDEGAAARERRRLVLDELERVIRPAHDDVLGLLRADRSPMPFRGRSRELGHLAEWYADESASPVLMVSGPAGVGKSRLALEFGLRLPQGWARGWLHAGSGGDAVGAVRACGDPAVILVDDADGRADLIPLLESLAEERKNPAIRVVLVTRSAVALRTALLAWLEERHAWITSGATELDLGPEGGQDDWSRWFGEAVRAFAGALDMSEPVLPERYPQGPAGVVRPFVVLQAQALLAVLDAGPDQSDPRDLPFRQVAEALMSHEQRRWRAIAATWDWGGVGPPSPNVQERSVAALCLLGAVGDAEAEEVLRRVPELRDATVERLAAIASWIWALYPAGPGLAPGIRPDMIGDWFVASQLTAHPTLARGLQAGLTDDQAARALGLLARAADRVESAASLFSEFAGGDIRRIVRASALAAMTGEMGRRLLDPVIAEQLRSAGEWTVDQLTELESLLPERVLLLTHVAIADRLVTVHRVLAADDAAHRAGLARALANLGIRLDHVGRDQEALAATQEAVTIYRALAADNPAAHQARLAEVLYNLGIWLDHVGCYREAVEAGQEAVTFYRALAADNPAAHQARLAEVLYNLGIWFDHVGRYREGLEASQEAVTLYRALAAGDPASHQANRARALTTLGSRLDQLGRYEEAVEASQEALTLYRALAVDNSASHQAHLADALNDLGVHLVQLGRYKQAVEAGQEAVTLRRALAADNPAAHQAHLALMLSNLGGHLDKLGRYQEALDAGQEAVTLRRALAADNPAAHQAHLAAALDNLGTRLKRFGRYQEALDAVQEAVTLDRALVIENAAAYQGGLATALFNLGNRLYEVGRYREGLEASLEAVALYRALAADNPAAYQVGLAEALYNLGIHLDYAGRSQEALAARTESVRNYRELASRNPDQYQTEYKRQLGALLREYEQRGMQDKAITHDLVDPAD